MLFYVLTIMFYLVVLQLFLFAFYPVIVKFIAKNRRLEKQELMEFPPISVIVPTYNEEEDIGRKIENLEGLNYPRNKIEIIIVDNGSIDSTVEIANKYPVRVIDLKEKGKIKAINKGIENAKNNLIATTDADVLLNKDIIKKSLRYLKGNVKAVGGKSIIKCDKKSFFVEAKKRYHENDWEMRYLESFLGSSCSLDGKYILFDKEYVNKINESAFTDDLEMTFDLKRKGFKVVVPEDCVLDEYIKGDMLEDINRMRRRCKLSILDSFRNLDLLFKKFDYYSTFIFPLRRFLNFLTPFYIVYSFSYLLLEIPLVLSLGLVLWIIFSLLSRRVLYYNLLVVSLSLAWLDILTGNYTTGAKWNL